jgi:hypothetical protein
VTSADQVQITSRRRSEQVPTAGSLTATQYLKDNRLLPRGFDKASADPMIGVMARRPRRRLRQWRSRPLVVDVRTAGRSPWTWSFYQSIGYHWAHNLEKQDLRSRGVFSTTMPCLGLGNRDGKGIGEPGETGRLE